MDNVYLLLAIARDDAPKIGRGVATFTAEARELVRRIQQIARTAPEDDEHAQASIDDVFDELKDTLKGLLYCLGPLFDLFPGEYDEWMSKIAKMDDFDVYTAFASRLDPAKPVSPPDLAMAERLWDSMGMDDQDGAKRLREIITRFDTVFEAERMTDNPTSMDKVHLLLVIARQMSPKIKAGLTQVAAEARGVAERIYHLVENPSGDFAQDDASGEAMMDEMQGVCKSLLACLDPLFDLFPGESEALAKRIDDMEDLEVYKTFPLRLDPAKTPSKPAVEIAEKLWDSMGMDGEGARFRAIERLFETRTDKERQEKGVVERLSKMDKVYLLLLVARNVSPKIKAGLSMTTSDANELARRMYQFVEKPSNDPDVDKASIDSLTGELKKVCKSLLFCLDPLFMLFPGEHDAWMRKIDEMEGFGVYETFPLRLDPLTPAPQTDLVLAEKLWDLLGMDDEESRFREIEERFESAVDKPYVHSLPYSPTYDDEQDGEDDFKIAAVYGGRGNMGVRGWYAAAACIAMSLLSAMAPSFGA